jgi:hypothetical protein
MRVCIQANVELKFSERRFALRHRSNTRPSVQASASVAFIDNTNGIGANVTASPKDTGSASSSTPQALVRPELAAPPPFDILDSKRAKIDDVFKVNSSSTEGVRKVRRCCGRLVQVSSVVRPLELSFCLSVRCSFKGACIWTHSSGSVIMFL